MCSIADTEARSFRDLVRCLSHCGILDLTTQTDAPDDAWEQEVTGWDRRSTRDPSSGSSFWPQPPEAASRLGPHLVPPSRLVRADGEMSAHESETSRVPYPHPSASDLAPPDVPVAAVEPENSAQTVSMRSITFKRPPNAFGRAEPSKRTRADDDEDSALFSVYHRDLEKVSENLNDGKVVSSKLKHIKVDQVDENYDGPSQKDVDNFVGHSQLFLR